MAFARYRPRIDRVSSTLKSPTGQPWSVDLGHVTLITGKNGGHKSMVAQAVQLALTGTVDDLVGRDDVASAERLIDLAPEDAQGNRELWAAVTLTPPDGEGDYAQTATYQLKQYGKYGKLNGPHHSTPAYVDPEKVLVLKPVISALSGGADTAAKAFLSWASAKTSIHDMADHIRQHVADDRGKGAGPAAAKAAAAKFLDIAEAVKRKHATDRFSKTEPLNAVDILERVADYCAKASRKARSEAKTLFSSADAIEANTSNEGVGIVDPKVEKLSSSEIEAEMERIDLEMGRVENQIDQLMHQL